MCISAMIRSLSIGLMERGYVLNERNESLTIEGYHKKNDDLGIRLVDQGGQCDVCDWCNWVNTGRY